MCVVLQRVLCAFGSYPDRSISVDHWPRGGGMSQNRILDAGGLREWRHFMAHVKPQFITRHLLFSRLKFAAADTGLMPDLLQLIVGYAINSLLACGVGKEVRIRPAATSGASDTYPERGATNWLCDSPLTMRDHMQPILRWLVSHSHVSFTCFVSLAFR